MINDDVFLSILSMDSYNRGGAGLALSGGLGEATFAGDRENPATGFFATQYNWNGKTIISFRGTDFANGTPALDDMANGWVNGVGALGGQLADAELYYRDVTGGATLTSGAESDVVLVGHSLGGGLAGFIGYTTGTAAYMVDGMPYWASAAAWHFFHFHSLPTQNNVWSVYVDQEALEIVRSAPPEAALSLVYPNVIADLIAPGASTIQSQQQQHTDVLNPQGTRPANAVGLNVDLHSAGLAVILQYAWNPGGAPLHQSWFTIGQAFIDALYNKDVSIAATTGSAHGEQQEVGKLHQMIAYSAIDEGVRPFGDTAIRAMFNDADEVGALSLSSSSVGDMAVPLAEISVQFAGHLATRDIEAANRPDVLGGVVLVDALNQRLTVSFAVRREDHVAIARAGYVVGSAARDHEGDGVELTNGVSTYFDMNADGWSERTAWTRGGDGFLVRDVNGNGAIDNITEMFGDATTPGHAALAASRRDDDHIYDLAA